MIDLGGMEKGEVLDLIWERLAWPPREGREFCWLWTGSYSGTGQPALPVAVGGKRMYLAPARVVYELDTGVELGRQYLKRNCGNQACVNPAHGYIAPGKGRGASKRREQQATAHE